MRFLHTADWHLGRQLHNQTLLNEQSHALDQLVEWVVEHRVDAVLMAGDVYDRAVPPTDAVALLSHTLDRLCRELAVPVVMIPGNHDSAERLGFAAAQLAPAGLHVRASLGDDPDPVVLRDAHGDVAVYAFPYVDPPHARVAFDRDFASHQDVMAFLCDRALAHNPADRRCVAMAHAFVDGGDPSDSERPLSIGGSDRVEAACFDGFHYAALGHLHGPQSKGRPTTRYSGSLGKFSFSEVHHNKGVSLVDLDAAGEVVLSHLPFSPKRDLRVVEGHFDELLEAPDPQVVDHYLMIRLLDRGAILDAMPRLREVYPHVLHLERMAFAPEQAFRPTRPHPAHGVLPLFDNFMRDVTGAKLDRAQRALLEDVLGDLTRGEL